MSADPGADELAHAPTTAEASKPGAAQNEQPEPVAASRAGGDSVRDSAIVCAAVGFISSIAIAVASYSQGATIFRPRWSGAVVPHPAGEAMRYVYYVALFALSVCWLLIRRQIHAGTWSFTSLRAVSWLWAAPMMVAMPIASRDVWAYAGQSNVLRHGLDPYKFGPASVPGAFTHQVANYYRTTPTPYGPTWVEMGRVIVGASGGHVRLAMLAFRVLALVGLVLVSLTLPRLARAGGGSPTHAAWLFLLNPLVIVIGLGGAHNDLLMVGLMAAGAWLATTAAKPAVSLGLATVVMTLAASVKLPAVVGIAFLPLIWLRCSPTGQRFAQRKYAVWIASAIVAVVAIAVVALITVATGLTDGWLVRLNTVNRGATWISIPVLVVLLLKYLNGGSVDALTSVTHSWQLLEAKLATIVAAIAIPLLWWRSWHRNPFAYLALALFVSMLLGTIVLPWYAVWPLATAAVIALTGRTQAVIAAACLAFTFALQEDGVEVLHRLTMVGLAVFFIAVVGVLLWPVLRTSPVAEPAAS